MIDKDEMVRAVATYKQLFVFENPERVLLIVATLNRALRSAPIFGARLRE